MDKETVSPAYLKMAQYAAEQCTGCSDSPMILACLKHMKKERIPLKNSIRSLELQFQRKYYYL